MEQLIARAMMMDVEQILSAVLLLHKQAGETPTTEQRLVRAALLQAYENKTSGEDLDLLIDKIGL